jgi:hypothetical protein
MGLFSQFWSRLGDTPRSGREAVDASCRGEAIQPQAIMLWNLEAGGFAALTFPDFDHRHLNDRGGLRVRLTGSLAYRLNPWPRAFD